MRIHLSQYCNVYNNAFITGLGQLLVKDMPSEYIKLLAGLPEDEQKRLLQQNYQRLPARFVQTVDERIGIEISGGQTSQEQLTQLTQQLEQHLTDMQKNSAVRLNSSLLL